MCPRYVRAHPDIAVELVDQVADIARIRRFVASVYEDIGFRRCVSGFLVDQPQETRRLLAEDDMAGVHVLGLSVDHSIGRLRRGPVLDVVPRPFDGDHGHVIVPAHMFPPEGAQFTDAHSRQKQEQHIWPDRMDVEPAPFSLQCILFHEADFVGREHDDIFIVSLLFIQTLEAEPEALLYRFAGIVCKIFHRDAPFVCPVQDVEDLLDRRGREP